MNIGVNKSLLFVGQLGWAAPKAVTQTPESSTLGLSFDGVSCVEPLLGPSSTAATRTCLLQNRLHLEASQLQVAL